MPALNFKRQFMAAVLNGTKTQTIRATRKHPIKVGDLLHLYTGMRTKHCMRLMVTRCTRVRPIVIDHGNFKVAGKRLNYEEAQALARADGFANEREFTEFFARTHGLPFKGQLIEWRM